MLASLLKVHEVVVSAPACVTPWGPLVRDTGWDLVSTLSPGRTGSPGRRMHRRRRNVPSGASRAAPGPATASGGSSERSQVEKVEKWCLQPLGVCAAPEELPPGARGS